MNKQPDEIFCPECGKPVNRKTVICPKCGVQIKELSVEKQQNPPKSKAAAVVLAIFFGYWAYLYTYARDRANFWGLLVVEIIFGSILWVMLKNGNFDSEPRMMLFLIAPLILFCNILPIINIAIRPDNFYNAYPNIPGDWKRWHDFLPKDEKSKNNSVLSKEMQKKINDFKSKKK